jgi:hypothetical protein
MKSRVISFVIAAAVAALIGGASVSQLRAGPVQSNLNCPVCQSDEQCRSSICPYCQGICSDIR